MAATLFCVTSNECAQPSITFFHFARIFSFSSGVDSATGGKSFIHSNGRQASMTARELKLFARLNLRIERAAPAAANLDGLDGIRAAGQRPDNIERIGRINILVDDDDIAAEISAGVNL